MSGDITEAAGAGAIELRLGHSLLRRRQLLVLMGTLGALALAPLAYLVIWLAMENRFTPAALARVGREMLANVTALEYGVLVVGLLALAGWFAATRRSWLRLGPEGLAGYLPPWSGMGFSGLSTGPLRLRWAEVESATLSRPARARNRVERLGRTRLVVKTGGREVTLTPFLWVRRQGPDHRLSLGAAASFRRLDVEALLRRAPLVEILEDRGVAVGIDDPGPERGRTGYDLLRHPGLAAQLGVAAVFGGYAVFDGLFLSPYRLIGDPPWAVFAVVGILTAAVAAQAGRGAPAVERLAVAMLTVTAVAGAAYPALLRLNAFAGEIERVPYVAVTSGRFESRDPGYPALDLRDLDVAEYWSRYPPGTRHPFVIIRGIAGLSQLDLSPLLERTRTFYAGSATGARNR